MLKTLWIISTAIVLLLVTTFYHFTQQPFSPNEQKVITLGEPVSVHNWLVSSDMSKTQKTIFKTLAWFRRTKRFRPGRYVIDTHESLWSVFSRLRSASQDPIVIKLDPISTLEEMCGILGNHLWHDSTSFINYLSSDSCLIETKTNIACIPCHIIPDTYEFYWTITPKEFFRKVKQRRESYWSNDQLLKAAQTKLTKEEICILASIVKAETASLDEAKKVAGLYMNRLRMKMPLQSDPTALFRNGKKNQRRVWQSDTQHESIYNTYKIIGLPPGPICFIENNYLDAVINFENHNNLYMCAQPGGNGKHSFTNSYEAHLKNAKDYQEWCRKNGIR